jgi:hypothetical protein
MVIILILLVVAIIGVACFAVFNSSNIKKTSAGYTTVGSNNGITASACKTYNSAWGGFYAVKVLITKAASTPAVTYNVYDVTGSTGSQQTVSNAYYAGTVAAMTINMSVVNKDYIIINIPYTYFIYPGNGPGGSNVKGINQITTC